MTNTSASKFVKARSVEFGATKWTRGFWADRFANCRESMVPTMGKLMTDTDRTRYVGNFEVAIGKVEGKHRGPKWNDGDFYKWLQSAAAIFATTKDPALDRQMDEYIALIAKAQDPDGYIHTDVQIAKNAGEKKERFGNPMDFEMYNFGHLMTAACVHHQATGKTNLLAVARKGADFLAGVFAKPTKEMARHGICPSHLMGLVELFRTTREKKYLDLAVTLLNMRDLVEKGDDDNQDRVPFREQRVAHGHAVRATYLYAGAADIYTENGDKELLEPIASIWNDLVSKKLYITGGCGALFDGASPDGSIDQEFITRVHQSFGRNYQLPQSTAHNETCAAIGNLLWSWRMFLITGEAKYAEIVEHTLLNAVLAGISLDGTAFFYTNTLRQLDPMPVDLRWPQTRQKRLDCFCCPPNVVRTVAECGDYAYAQNDRGVFVVMYGGSTLDTKLADGTRVKISQETDYPWNGQITLRVDGEGKEFSLMLRIPGWAKDASLLINGKASGAPKTGTFHEIRRVWSAGDVVELQLPMPVRVVEAHPLVEESLNQVAVMRGPVVYCLESPDLPVGVRVMEVLLPRSATFAIDHGDDLHGFVTLGTRALARQRNDWGENLYRDAASGPLREIDIRLIPYFAWDNRGKSEMTVWIPVAG